MSLRSITAVAIMLLLLCGCATANKPSDPTANDLERRQDEMMKRMGSGSSM